MPESNDRTARQEQRAAELVGKLETAVANWDTLTSDQRAKAQRAAVYLVVLLVRLHLGLNGTDEPPPPTL